MRRRTFDSLVGVGPVMNGCYDAAENEAFMRTLKVRGASKKPGRGIEVHWAERDENDLYEDFDLVFANPPRGGRYVDIKKRKRKEIEQEIRAMDIGPHSLWQLYLARKAKLENLPERIERYTLREPLGNLLLESDPNNDDNKMRAIKAREYETSMTLRSSRTWKNSGRVKRAGAQWGRHEETVHVPWSIVDEACATYLAWKREDEEWAQVFEQALSNLFLMDEAREADRYFEADLLDDLEWRYNYGYWCHSEDGPVWADDVDDDIDFTKDEEWAWQQAAA